MLCLMSRCCCCCWLMSCWMSWVSWHVLSSKSEWRHVWISFFFGSCASRQGSSLCLFFCGLCVGEFEPSVEDERLSYILLKAASLMHPLLISHSWKMVSVFCFSGLQICIVSWLALVVGYTPWFSGFEIAGSKVFGPPHLK